MLMKNAAALFIAAHSSRRARFASISCSSCTSNQLLLLGLLLPQAALQRVKSLSSHVPVPAERSNDFACPGNNFPTRHQHQCGVAEGYARGYAPAPTERPHTIHTWIQHLIMERIQDGGINVASALQAQMHRVLSSAMLAYEQCKCAPSLFTFSVFFSVFLTLAAAHHRVLAVTSTQ
jgi:hypothetical protein